MGGNKTAVTVQHSTGPVVLHLDRAVANDLLQALTQALEPHSLNIDFAKDKGGKGGSLKSPK